MSEKIMNPNTSNESDVKKNKTLTIIGIVLCVILVPMLIINCTLIFKSFINKDEVPNIGGIMPLIVLTDSMYPDIKSGDIIVTISDGILDADGNDNNWLQKYLINATREPKQLAQDILQKAKELNGGKSKDDMTVVVSKVSNLN